MNTRTINPVQLHLLEMFNYCGSEQTVSEMKDVLADFYAKKVQKEADRSGGFAIRPPEYKDL